jgi:hypothetical protein
VNISYIFSNGSEGHKEKEDHKAKVTHFRMARRLVQLQRSHRNASNESSTSEASADEDIGLADRLIFAWNNMSTEVGSEVLLTQVRGGGG